MDLRKTVIALSHFGYIIMTDRSDFFSFALLFSSPMTTLPTTHHAFLSSADIFSKSTLLNFLSGIPSECQTI